MLITQYGTALIKLRNYFHNSVRNNTLNIARNYANSVV
jgi:hypothetical protein